MSGRPRWLPVAAIASVAIVTVLAWAPRLDSMPRRLACTVLPNLLVPVLASPDGTCPLWAYDSILAVESAGARVPVYQLADLAQIVSAANGPLRIEVERRGRTIWQPVAVLSETPARQVGRLITAAVVGGVLLATGLLVFWNSMACAAPPFLIFYTCVSALLVGVLSGRASTLLTMAELAATGAISASLVHLALTFPRERDLLRRFPSIIIWPYVAAAALVAVQFATFDASPVTWRLLDHALVAAGLGAWIALVLGCLLALRESVSPLERARARVLVRGVVAVPVLLVGLSLLVPDALPAGGAARAGLGVIVLPLPIGYAIARYQLFDLGRDVREAIVYLFQLTAVSALLSLGWTVGIRIFDLDLPVDDPMVVFAFAFLGLLVSDPLRVLLQGLLDGWSPPRRAFLRQLAEEQAERLAELRPATEQAEILCGAARLGLGARGATLFVRDGGSWSLACASGVEAHVAAAVVGEATLVAGAGGPVHLARLEEIPAGAPFEAMQRAGVEVLVPVRCGDAIFGCLLVGPARSGVPYGNEHLAFLRGVAARAAVALQNGTLLQELVAAERFATLGRVAAELAHEIGKPLGVLERLAQRLPERSEDRARVGRDAATMAALAGEMRTTVQGLLGAARREAVPTDDGRRLRTEALIERAVAEVSRIHGPGRVAQRLAPELPELPARAEPLVRVLVNLLDNALRASAAEEVVELRAELGDQVLRIEVIDRGSGMSAELLRMAQQPFFTTRTEGVGTGLGLFVSRRIVESLSGALSLRSLPGTGTRATLSLPLEASTPTEG